MIKITAVLPDEAKKIREEVFIQEQGFINEFDDVDFISRHLVMYKDNVAIATCRFYRDKNDLFWIGRIAVRKAFRGQNIGKIIVEEAEKEIKKLGGKGVEISAQVRAKGFYEKLGYLAIGEIYLDEDCPHIHMQKHF